MRSLTKNQFIKSAFVFLFLLMQRAFALELGIDAHVDLSEQITQFQIFSERCSGSNFLQNLVLDNLMTNGKNLEVTSNFGHKHFPRWFELPQSAYHREHQKYTFESNANTLFIVIFRDPYDWARSFNLTPYHSTPELQKLPFSNFIRVPWRVNANEKWIAKEKKDNPFVDIDPMTRKPFRNIFQLRKQKIKTMLEIKDRVQNIYVINYETLRDFPEKVLDEIAQLFELERKEEYTPVIYHKGIRANGKYRPKKYAPISQADLDWINSQLDPEVEESIGYELVKRANKADTR